MHDTGVRLAQENPFWLRAGEEALDKGQQVRLHPRQEAGGVGDVDAMPTASRYALTKSLERTWGDVLREGKGIQDATHAGASHLGFSSMRLGSVCDAQRHRPAGPKAYRCWVTCSLVVVLSPAL
jgi:hypothetical protein